MKTLLKSELRIFFVALIFLSMQFRANLGSSGNKKVDQVFVEFNRNYTGVYLDCEDFMEYNGIPRSMGAADVKRLISKIHTRFDKILISYHVHPRKRDSDLCLENIAHQNIIINETGSKSTLTVAALFRISHWGDVNLLTKRILQARKVMEKTNLLFPGTVESVILETADGPASFIENYVMLQSIIRNDSLDGSERNSLAKYKLGLKLDIEHCARLTSLPSNTSLDVALLVKFWKPQLAELSAEKSVELIKNHFSHCRSQMNRENASVKVHQMGLMATWPDTHLEGHGKYSKLVAFWRKFNGWAGDSKHEVIFHQAFDAPFAPHPVLKTSGWWRLIPNSSYFNKNGKQFVWEEKSAMLDAERQPLNLTWLRSPTDFSDNHVGILFNPTALIQAVVKPLPETEVTFSGLIKHVATKFSKIVISADSQLLRRNNESYLGRVGNKLILSLPREVARLNLVGSRKNDSGKSLQLFMTFDEETAKDVMKLAQEGNEIFNGTVKQLIYNPSTLDRSKLLDGFVEVAKVGERLDIIRKFTYGVGLNVEVCRNRSRFGEVMTSLKPYFNYFSPKVIFISGNVTRDYSLMGVGRVFPLFTEMFEVCKMLVGEHFSSLGEVMEVVVSTKWGIYGDDELDGVLEFVKFWEQMNEWAVRTNTTVILASAFDTHKGGSGSLGGMSKAEDEYGWWSLVEDDASGTGRGNANGYTFEDKKEVALRYATEEPSKAPTPKTLSAIHISVIFLTLLFIIALLSIGYMLKTRKSNNLTETDIKNFLHGDDSGSLGGCPEGIKGPYMKTSVELAKKAFRIDEASPLGSGQFGKVCRGTIIRGNGEEKEEVAVKMTKVPCPRSSFRGLLFEIKILSYLGTHPHVVELKGAYTAELKKRKAFVFLELCALGSLQDYLRKRKPKLPTSRYNLGESEDEVEIAHDEYPDGMPKLDESLARDMSRWSGEIASGLEFIASKHIVHLDIATRNILLTGDKRAKITDFGLSRRMYDYQTYVKKAQEPLPWRWMAPESFRKSEFTEKSDVWAFGVLLWEIYSLGDEPYPGLSFDFNFATKLERGLRLDEPPYNSNGIYSVMLTCWATNPERRPTFSELARILGSSILESEEVLEVGAAKKDETPPATGNTGMPSDESNRELVTNSSDKIREISSKKEATGWLSRRCAWSLLASVLMLLVLMTITWVLYGHLLRYLNVKDINKSSSSVLRKSSTVVALNSLVPGPQATDTQIGEEQSLKDLEKNNFHASVDTRRVSETAESETGANTNNLLKDGSSLLNEKLFNAIERRDEEAVKVVVQVGADVNARNAKSNSPLIEATLNFDRNIEDARKTAIRIIKYLIEHGADVYARDTGDRTFLHNLVSQGTRINSFEFHDIVTYLVSKNMSTLFSLPGWSHHAPLLLVAVINIEIEGRTLSLLHQSGVNLNMFSSNGNSILMSVFEGNRSTNLLSVLIDHGAEWNYVNAYNSTLLHGAAQFGHSDGVKYFLKLGLDVNVVDNYGDTPLHFAVLFGKEGVLETVLVLLENGANITIENLNGRTALVEALRREDSFPNRKEVVYLLNSRQFPKENLTSTFQTDQSKETGQESATDSASDAHIGRNETNLSAFLNENMSLDQKLFASISNRDEEAIKALVQLGADVNARNNKSNTPLIAATFDFDRNLDDAWNTSIRIIKYLIEHGADVYARDTGNRTFLHNLVSQFTTLTPKHFHDLVTYLISKNMTKLFSLRGWAHNAPLLLVAVMNIEIEGRTISLLQRNGVSLNVNGSSGDSILTSVFEGNRSTNLLSDLIAHGAEWNHVNDYDATLLHRAAQYGHTDGVKYLLNLGLNVNAVDNDGDTPLHYAALYGEMGILETVPVLLENGASITTENSFGRTPFDEALKRDSSLNDKDGVLQLLWDSSGSQKYPNATESSASVVGEKVKQEVTYCSPEASLVQVAQCKNKTLAINAIKGLLDNGTYPKLKDREGYYFLHRLVGEGTNLTPNQFHEFAIFLLLKRLSDLFNTQGWFRETSGAVPGCKYTYQITTPFQLAVKNLEVETGTLKLLHQFGVEFNARNNLGDNVLCYTALGRRSTRLVTDLIALGVNPKHFGDRGNTLLHYSSAFGSLEQVKYYSSLGIDINLANSYGRTPLSEATRCHSEDSLGIITFLLQNGANATVEDDFGDTSLSSVLGWEDSIEKEKALLFLEEIK